MLWAHPGKPRETQRDGPPAEADACSCPDFGLRHDVQQVSLPEETRVGQFLRFARIDDLPQLIDILRGEMTLIGTGLEPGRSSTSALADGEQEVGIIWTAA